MKSLSTLLAVIAVGLFIFGMSSANGAPQEAAISAMACFIGIISRLCQAEAHQQEIIKLMKPDEDTKLTSSETPQ